ncbi:type III PLP-dependent enzyme [Natronosporangium hydrolyticum]|uniref:Type III PLP-dependent enzyme n=1 Tax=Natronosporangium hydrolyticum TaxID=2811111 RepID=A0A895YJ02_9ACTN|nr:type III PLP-dependent enzyme [Natronosporangium hydrolyticum]QSB16012.1 type III PLP-dependent enzyme [Natronosporangium hydrolyticum]
MSRNSQLARRYGTPTYIYDLDQVRQARRDLFAALPEAADLFYAIKANPHPEVVRATRDGEGRRCRAEISSTGELAAALEAGYVASECLYTGPGKTTAELHEVIGSGVALFSVESEGDLRRIGRVATARGVVVDCLLRINSAAARASTSIRMTGAPSQFGFDSETLAEALPRLREVPGARLTGAHFFPLSNATDEASLVGEFQHTIAVAADLDRQLALPLKLVDIGGGFAAPYAVPGQRPRYDKLRSELEAALDIHFAQWREGNPRVAVESGRYLVGSAGTLVCQVVNVKVSRGRRFVILDGGINSFGGMSGLGRLLPPAVRVAEDAAVEPATLVGPLCTPGDVIGRDVPLPELTEGDLIEIPNAGAYGVTASLLAFLGRPAPTEVSIRGNRVVSVSRLEQQRRYGVQ